MRREAARSYEKPYGRMFSASPTPIPSVARPLLMWSSERKVCARTAGWRRTASVTAVPSLMRSVPIAAAAITVIGSRNACGLRTAPAIGVTSGVQTPGGNQCRKWSDHQTASKPASSEARTPARAASTGGRMPAYAPTSRGRIRAQANRRAPAPAPYPASRATRRVPEALNEAIAISPSARPRRSAESAVTSAVIGPTATRTRLPRRTSEPMGPRTWFSDESSGSDSETITSAGCTTTPTRPLISSLE